jgi:hypothetical protein
VRREFTDGVPRELAALQQLFERVEHLAVAFAECCFRAPGKEWARCPDEETSEGVMGLGRNVSLLFGY